MGTPPIGQYCFGTPPALPAREPRPAATMMLATLTNQPP
jgi:hypothetical protein